MYVPFNNYFRTIKLIVFSLRVQDSPENTYDDEAWERVVQYVRRFNLKTLHMNVFAFVPRLSSAESQRRPGR